ncbi:MAG: hypothetical protein FJY92_09550 [Candidatus Hydrogenedentes bacterium]|nr:hypothetical protein [Candidatus Hydrogenedentota bacterium]
MGKESKRWQEWERAQIAATPPDFFRNQEILEAMVAQAREAGVWERGDPLEGIEFKSALAKKLNVQLPPRKPGR